MEHLAASLAGETPIAFHVSAGVSEVSFLRVAFPARRNKSSRKGRAFLYWPWGKEKGGTKVGGGARERERHRGESGES